MNGGTQTVRQRLPLVGGLFRRLFFHHVLLVSAPVAVLGFLLISIAENSIGQTLANDNLEITRRAQGQIQYYVESVLHQLHLVGVALEQLEMAPRPSEQFLTQVKLDTAATSFTYMYEIDTLKSIVATTDFNVRAAGVLTPELAEPAERALKGREVAQPVRINQPAQAATVLFAIPLRSRFEETVGALIAEVDIKSVWEVIDGIQVGERGRAFLANAQGTVIAHQDKSIVYGGTDYSHLESVKRALAGNVGLFRPESAEAGGEPMMAAYAPITASGLTWALVIHRPLSEITATSGRMRLQILAVALIGIALALVSTLVYTQRVVRPIAALVDGANRLSQGDLSYKIPVAGRDELGTLAVEFNLMAERLSRIQERLRRVEHLDTLAKFSSVVAHEIRNPLNAMQINLHLLQERAADEEQEYLDVISSEIHRLENLVREFQTISRPPVISPRVTDVNRLLIDLVHLQKGKADLQRVEIETVLAPDLPPIVVDTNRVTQAVLNLVLNAMQAMPNGGRLTIRSAPREDQAGVRIEVSDTGEGIPQEDLGRVFDFYYTSRDSGSGLGLSISQQIVDEHGGQIALASTVGRGTRITILLPDRPPDDKSEDPPVDGDREQS